MAALAARHSAELSEERCRATERLDALKEEVARCTAEASAKCASAVAEAATLRRALRDREREVECSKDKTDLACLRMEEAQERAIEVERVTTEKVRAALEAGREEGRRGEKKR